MDLRTLDRPAKFSRRLKLAPLQKKLLVPGLTHSLCLIVHDVEFIVQFYLSPIPKHKVFIFCACVENWSKVNLPTS